MKFAANAITRAMQAATVVLAVSSFAIPAAQAQAPYLLPYTVTTLAGGGTAPTAGKACTGPNGSANFAADAVGDGCLVTSPSVVLGTDVHDVGVDGQGNVYFIDNASNGLVRRIDARSGLVTAFVSTATANTVVCTTAVDKYGDGCVSTDAGLIGATNNSGTTYYGGNAQGGYTNVLAKARGITVAKNGDVYIADYSGYILHKVSASTGIMSIILGVVSGTSVKTTTATAGYFGDGGPATAAKENSARGIAADAAGDVVFADTGNNVIRAIYNGGASFANLISLTNKGITPTVGYVYTIGGVNPNAAGVSPGVAATNGATGDGQLATSAGVLFGAPEDVEIDANGNVFIGDFTNNKIRVIYSGGAAVANFIALANSGTVAQPGYVYTVVGVPSTNTTSYTAGTVVPSTSVGIGNPRKFTIDSHGNLFIADSTYDVVWFVDITTGYMRQIAGQSGKTSAGANCANQLDAYGDGCPATQATFSANSALATAIDTYGNLYVTDPSDSRLRKILTDQVFPATTAGTTVSQVLFVHYAAKDTQAGTNPFTITGSTDFTLNGTPQCTLNSDATTDCLQTINFNPTVAGPDSATLTMTSAAGLKTDIALSGSGLTPALALDPGTTAVVGSGFKTPAGVAIDIAGNTYVADTGNNRVVRYSTAGVATVLAGTGTANYTGDGSSATLATLSGPKGVAVTRDGAVYIADTGNNVVRRIDPLTGNISTYAGAGTLCVAAVDTYGDGCLGNAAKLSAPTALAADPTGNLYLTDTGNNLIREIAASGYIYLISGTATAPCSAGDTFGNNCSASGAIFKAPSGIALDTALNLYIADTGNNLVRKISSGNFVTIVAGTGQSGSSGNGGTATGAQVNAPSGVAIDAAGDVYISDSGNNAIRVVNASGLISTVAGTLGASGTGTLPGSAFSVLLNTPGAIASNGAGSITVLDTGNSRAFSIARGSLSYTFARTVPQTTSSALLIEETNTGSVPITFNSLYAASGSTGSFNIQPTTTSGCSASATAQAVGVGCGLTAQFAPTALGTVTATYLESGTTPVITPTPSITLTGTGALLTATTSTTVLTTPATGSPQYAVPFTVTTTVTNVCNTAAPACAPTGTVSFYVNGVQVGVPVTLSSTGTASTTIAGQSVTTTASGPLQIVAVYSGDGYYASSTAATLKLNVVQGTAVATVSANPLSGPQFGALTFTSTVKSATTTDIPTGTVTFYAGTTALGTASLSIGGTATLSDPSASFGLVAGTYQLTAVYNGSGNYATATSSALSLVIQADTASFVLSLNTAAATGFNNTDPTGTTVPGTAQGSTAQDELTILPTNTLSGTMTFTCSGMPTNSVCTFSPTSLTFASVAGAPASQQLQVTLWTDVAPGTNPAQTSSSLRRPGLSSGKRTALASILGWPLLLLSFTATFGFRKRLRYTRLFAAIALCGLALGSSAVMTGCFNPKPTSSLTPTGTYTVTITATGPQGTKATLPVTFTVGAGIAGQE